MDKRSSADRAEEWRVDWLSGQPPCRTPIGAASRGTDIVALFFYPFFAPFRKVFLLSPPLILNNTLWFKRASVAM